MNLAERAIKYSVISWVFTFLLIVGGIVSFFKLGQLEFPEFTIREAMVVTSYPGATPEQVEEEVSVLLEDTIQQLPYVNHVTSVNSDGLSQIKVEIKDQFASSSLPQIWDELRRKINDVQNELPPGSLPSLVIDDFGDVYGILLNITGAGYEYRHLESYSDLLRRELVLVPGVKKVSVDGVIPEQIFIEFSREKMTSLDIDLQHIFNLLESQNTVSNAGRLFTQDLSLRIQPTGEFKDVEELGDLLVSSSGSQQLVYLSDIATISRGYSEHPRKLYFSDSKPALSIGVSFMPGVNVVDVGKAVMNKINDLESERPVGMDVSSVYNQAEVVDKTVSGFLINLAEAVAIVIVVLFLFMGLHNGLMIGAALLLTILGTFIIMWLFRIDLQMISLGALIIALGMLVDNAIVVKEGMLIGLSKGMSKIEAARQVVSQTQWPLLAATLIAITAFAPIGLSPDATGEFAGSLFWVLLISLLLSWVIGVTLTPFFFNAFYHDSNENSSEKPYQGVFFNAYRFLLRTAMKHRVPTLIVMFAALITSGYGFTKVKNVFFPASTTPIFFVDYWLPEGSDIRATTDAAKALENGVKSLDGVTNVTTVIGGGAQRFVLPYAPEDNYESYAQLIVEAGDIHTLNNVIVDTTALLRKEHSQAEFRLKNLENGPSPAAKLEARFYGSNPDILRSLAEKAIDIVDEDPWTTSIRHSWRNRVNVIRPEYQEAQGRRAGISKQALDEALLVNFSGKQIGTYRDGSNLIPIVSRAPDSERFSADSLKDLQLWSPEYQSYVPISQVVSDITLTSDDPLIKRRDRKRMIAVYAEPMLLSGETADSVLSRIKEKVEGIDLPKGYTLEWGGEYESASQAQAGLFGSLPYGLLFMFLISIFLFNSIKQPIVIWLTVPLAIIGVVCGLLLFDKPFSFMALLGILSLTGMLIKNGIVLVEQINIERASGKALYDAIFDSSVSRVRPVSMAAITTMLGMIPLLFDAFFDSMAVTIIFGLGFATVITLIVLPVIYAIMFRVKPN